MKTKRLILLILLALIILSLSGCVPNDGTYTADNPAGFFAGLWHGIIWFITFLMGLFTKNQYTIYEAVNKGWTYNLGFLIGIGAFFGGGSYTGVKIRTHRCDNDD